MACCEDIVSPFALCPKVNEGLGVSAAAVAEGVSLFSAVLPNRDEGSAAGALGLSKTKPPREDGGGAAAAAAAPSLAATPNRVGASFFSSGFPKANVGAAASEDPNVALPCGVEIVRLGSPNLLNTDTEEEEGVVVVVEFPSLFS